MTEISLSKEFKPEFDKCIKNFAETGKFPRTDSQVVRSVFEEHGANFDKLDGEGRESLTKYSNKGKHVGMEQVWGSSLGSLSLRYKFKIWAEKWAMDYEKSTGKELPTIIFTDEDTGKKTPSKTEGMRQFLGELTAYAAGCLQFTDIEKRLEARYYNFERSGKIPEEDGGRRKMVISGHNIIKETGKEKPFALASIPPEFPKDAWDWLQTQK